MSSTITPYIRCTSGAQDQAHYYYNIFPDATIISSNAVVTQIEIFGSRIATINGGEYPEGILNPSISLSLWIKDEDLTRQIWDKLSEGGSVMMEYGSYPRSPGYGWCNDKFGVSRQVMRDNRSETSSHALVPSMMFVGDNVGKAQDAMKLYTSWFADSRIDMVAVYGDNSMGEDPTHVSHAEFTLAGQQFIAMDSGQDHQFQFNDGVSLMILCQDQAEVDYYWDTIISDGGQASQCGWCKDKFGVARQVVPVQLPQVLFHSDPATSEYAMSQMISMSKIVIEDLYKD